MATAGDRLQIALTTKNEISSELKQVKADMNSLGRTATDLRRRMDAGEQGLQNEYEQTRRELEKNRLKQLELGRAASKAQTEIRQMTTEGTTGARRMGRSFDGTTRSMDKTHRATMTMSSGWAKATGILAGAATVVYSLQTAFRFLGESVTEARDARKAMAQTAAVMKSMGRTEAPKAIDKMIDQLESMSGIDGDNIRQMTNILFTFGNVTEDTFTQANQLALDLSVSMDKDLASAATMVGKALNDPIKGLTSLSRVGVQFTAQQEEQIKAFVEGGEVAKAQKIILGELRREFGGSAAAQADGIAKMQVAWDNLKEAIGEALLASSPGWDLSGGIQKATRWIVKHQSEIKEALLGIAASAMRMGEIFLRVGGFVVRAYAEIAVTIGGMLKVIGLLIPGASEAGDALIKQAASAVQASESMYKSADAAATMADKTFAARDEIKKLNQALDTIDNKKVRIKIRTTVTSAVDAVQAAIDAANAAANGLAAGGSVSAGMTALVGEIGPELFVPTVGSPRIIGADGPEIRDFHTSGTVIPNHLLATVTVPKQSQPAGYSGPPVQIGTINAAADVDVEAGVLRAMLRADRIARERR